MQGGCQGGEGPIRGEAASTGSGWVASHSLVSVEGQGPGQPQRRLPRGICLSPRPPLQGVTSPTHASQPLQHSPHPEAALTCLCGPGLWGVHSLVPRPIRKSLKIDVSPRRGVWLCVRASAWRIHPGSPSPGGDVVLAALLWGLCPALRPPGGPCHGAHHRPWTRRGWHGLLWSRSPRPAAVGVLGPGCMPLSGWRPSSPLPS